jgi:hypothetical protein
MENEMNQVPHITESQFKVLHINNCVDGSLRALNCLIDKANAEQEQHLITAEEARKLGAGKAEYSFDANVWHVCRKGCEYLNVFKGKAFKYRAIKQAQPEPVDPHAALRAEYAKQVKDGTVGFYKWEFLNEVDDWQRCFSAFDGVSVEPLWLTNKSYRYTDISCMVALKGEPAKRMLRTEAQELQRKTKDTHNWFYVVNIPASNIFDFDCGGTYTYAPKALKIVKWANVPVGVAVRDKKTKSVWLHQGVSDFKQALVIALPNRQFAWQIDLKDLELAPASEQPWIPVIAPPEGFTVEYSSFHECLRITGLAEGYELK